MPTSRALPTTTFLDPAILAKIGNLELLARVVVEGFINGLHRSPHLGASTDFAEHRAYMPGDDIRRIDWRLFARSDRHYVKEFEADTNTNFMVLLDVSPSMRYGGGGAEAARVTKLQYACYLAAALTYFSSTQRDRVGLATFDRDLADYVPCSAKHLQLVLHALDRAGHGGAPRPPARTAAAAPARLVAPLKKLAESLRRRSITVLISDFYEEPEDILDAITFLRGRGNDVIVFHVLDRDELQFPFLDASNFVDVESGERMPVVPDYLRRQYRDLVAAHVADLERRLREQRMDYALFDTSRPLDQALFSYLLARERFTRVR
jgi:uncharacterized protein (DUF58 family)